MSLYDRIDIQDQIRVTRLEVEKRLNITLSMQHNIAPWLVRHCSWTLHRFHVNKETGLTGFSRLCGGTYFGKVVAFAEGVMAMSPERSSSTCRKVSFPLVTKPMLCINASGKERLLK